MSEPTVVYATIKDWLGEIDGFCPRGELVPDGALDWITTAWELGATAEREACAKVADDHVYDAFELTAMLIADAIRARENSAAKFAKLGG